MFIGSRFKEKTFSEFFQKKSNANIWKVLPWSSMQLVLVKEELFFLVSWSKLPHAASLLATLSGLSMDTLFIRESNFLWAVTGRKWNWKIDENAEHSILKAYSWVVEFSIETSIYFLEKSTGMYIFKVTVHHRIGFP